MPLRKSRTGLRNLAVEHLETRKLPSVSALVAPLQSVNHSAAPTAVVATQSAATVATPKISGIGGISLDSSGIVNGRAQEELGIHWNNDLVVNYDYLHSSDRSGGVFWTINGSGFGKTKGTVKIGGFTLPSNKVVWSDTAITVYPDGSMISSSSPYNWGPKSVQIQVITSNLKTTSWTDTIIPAIQTRVYGQCAWWVALRRIQLGLVPSTTAYGGYRPISTWIPQVGDQLEWTSGKITHSAIVESVSRSGNIYTIKISEYNLNCDNQYSTESPITFNILTHTFIKTFKLGTPSGWYR